MFAKLTLQGFVMSITQSNQNTQLAIGLMKWVKGSLKKVLKIIGERGRDTLVSLSKCMPQYFLIDSIPLSTKPKSFLAEFWLIFLHRWVPSFLNCSIADRN